MIEVGCLLLAGAVIGAIVLVIVSVAISESPPVEQPNVHLASARHQIEDIEMAAVMRMLTIAQEDSGA